MIARLGELLGRTVGRWIPDPFVIAVLLTVMTGILGIAFGDFGGRDGDLATRAVWMLDTWRGPEGIWKFLAFAMQMCLVLLTGSALVAAPVISRALDRLARFPRSRRSGAATVAVVACSLGLINWGLGLVAGAILARRMADAFDARGLVGHRAILAAAGYTGMMIWHGGLSGSAPLTMTTVSNAQKALPQVTIDALVAAGFGRADDPSAVMVPLSQTLFSPLNVAVSLGLLVIVPVVVWLLAGPTGQPAAEPPLGEPARTTRVAEESGRELTGSAIDRLFASPIVATILGVLVSGAFVRFVVVSGPGAIGIDQVNMAMLGAGILLHRSLASYAGAAEGAAKECSGIMLQFPLYAGIMGMMVSSGLVAQIARWGVGVVDPGLLPIAEFVLAAIINLFVPSGGGQWGVQGPIAIQAGLESGVSPGRMIMAVAYGDQLTNMLQPFWALPLLSITRTRPQQLVGFLAVIMAAGALWISACLIIGL